MHASSSSCSGLDGSASSTCAMQPAGTIVSACRTVDQARAVITFMDAASEKLLRSTVSPQRILA